MLRRGASDDTNGCDSTREATNSVVRASASVSDDENGCDSPGRATLFVVPRTDVAQGTQRAYLVVQEAGSVHRTGDPQNAQP